ncbi:hypothetical protein Hypma_012146 [Hypsizygus marmoreus]|uniref:Uncharacterized protein n=1 Tax=Hypsizygus marmoreus TaxID=39966 RepID=A0A369JMU6_HYPMA|nr:hypothetical protein Hypma_012146 [Hypsizygus marmoreus]
MFAPLSARRPCELLLTTSAIIQSRHWMRRRREVGVCTMERRVDDEGLSLIPPASDVLLLYILARIIPSIPATAPLPLHPASPTTFNFFISHLRQGDRPFRSHASCSLLKFRLRIMASLFQYTHNLSFGHPHLIPSLVRPYLSARFDLSEFTSPEGALGPNRTGICFDG